MDHEQLQQLIESSSGPKATQVRGLAFRLARLCWPRGSRDRADGIDVRWIEHWHRERAAMALPACSCATGRCIVCN